MKYITTKQGSIIIFWKSLTHKDVAQALSLDVQGAWFTDYTTCYGESTSLQVKATDRCTKILEFNKNI